KANKPIEFIETFTRHSKGKWAGKPVELELFQKAFIAALFGFVDKDTGLRRFKESMFYVARKNGKTTMLAGIALYMMIVVNTHYYNYSSRKQSMKELSKISNTLDRKNKHITVNDKLHSIQDRKIYEVMKQSQSARDQPLLIMITTAGTQRNTIFDEMYEYASNVVDGTFTDDTFLPIMYELEE